MNTASATEMNTASTTAVLTLVMNEGANIMTIELRNALREIPARQGGYDLTPWIFARVDDNVVHGIQNAHVGAGTDAAGYAALAHQLIAAGASRDDSINACPGLSEVRLRDALTTADVPVVRLYLNQCTRSISGRLNGTSWGLVPWGHNTPYIEGSTVDEADFYLPYGISLCETQLGTQGLFHGNEYVDIFTEGGDPWVHVPGVRASQKLFRTSRYNAKH